MSLCQPYPLVSALWLSLSPGLLRCQKTCTMHRREAEMWYKRQSQRCAAGWADFRVSLYFGWESYQWEHCRDNIEERGERNCAFCCDSDFGRESILRSECILAGFTQIFRIQAPVLGT